CIADDASTNPEVRQFLEQAARGEPRIRLTFRERNGHISACSNSAFALATGEWCALLDHDDVMAENALSWVALEIDEFPECGLIYSDEDKIDASGRRSEPFFKTDFDPQLLLGQNYINHLGIYRASLLREIGGFREGFEGSQDYDLALRCIERLRPEQVRHIPRILYHWRMAAGSLASEVDAKPYAREAARRAIADHLRRRQIAAQVAPCPENPESHRVIYDSPDPLPLVSVIIPMRDQVQLLVKCVRSLCEKTDYPAIQIIVVDNGSTERESLEILQNFGRESDFVVLRDEAQFNFGGLNNLALPAARGELLVFLNNDIEAAEPDWLREMVSHAVRPEVGAVGARLWYPDGTLQHGGVVLGLGGVAGHAHHRIPRGHPGYYNRAWLQHNCSAVTAACLVVRKQVFEEAHGFDEVNLPINFNDIDFCLRLRERGLQIIWTPYANLIHYESASRGHHATRGQQAQFFREATYMQERWGTQLLHDPFYSSNLTLQPPGYEIAFPPRWASLFEQPVLQRTRE
nr:glycosyltransferase family 2 protein [Chthoniobacterales bacterium]